MKIYTKTGDQGQTSLWGGKKVSKAHLQVEAYGNVDELNSFIGHLMASPSMHTHVHYPLLVSVQNQLFAVGAMLAQDPDRNRANKEFVLAETAPNILEKGIDELESSLPGLTNFILPSGSEACTRAHLCRTVCRRAERSVVQLSNSMAIAPIIIKYLNRLSDYFFVLSRHLAQSDGATETIWTAG